MSGLTLTALLPSLDPILIAIICVIFLLAGIVKGFLGIGLPAAAMAFLTLIISPTEAISLLWLPILFTNIFQFGRAPDRRRIAADYVWFAIPLAASIFITSLFITEYPTSFLTVAIGCAMVIFSLNLLFGVTIPIGPGLAWQGIFGVVSGVLGGLSSIWSPPVAMYLIARNTPKERFIGCRLPVSCRVRAAWHRACHGRADHLEGDREINARACRNADRVPHRRTDAQPGIAGPFPSDRACCVSHPWQQTDCHRPDLGSKGGLAFATPRDQLANDPPHEQIKQQAKQAHDQDCHPDQLVV